MSQIDSDFLQFEEDQTAKKDKERILSLLQANQPTKLPNPHNSCLLYVTGLSNEFNFEQARSDTIGGSPPDCN